MNDPNAHISTEEIKEDLAQTETEILFLEKDLLLATNKRDRWEVMKAENGIKQRREFIEKLLDLLSTRNNEN